MSEASDKLREMIGSAQTESENLQSGISQIEDIKEDVTEQISAIEDGLCTVAADDLTTYLISGNSTYCYFKFWWRLWKY